MGLELVNLAHLGVKGILDLDLALFKELFVDAHSFTAGFRVLVDEVDLPSRVVTVEPELVALASVNVSFEKL